MGNDFEARKRAKKRGKKQDIDPEIASEGGKRNRKKRAAIRSKCRGVCYNEPVLRDEDKGWNGAKVDSTEEPGTSKRRYVQAGLTEANKVRNQEKEKKDAAKAKRKQRKLENGQRMSTAIDLVDPESHPSDRLKPPAEGVAAQRDPLSAAMAPFPLPMQQYMQDQGFPEPMPIQERCWPFILEGKDVAATAEPGSGKTLGYLAPMLPMLQARGEGPDSHPDGPIALVLVPTRELALQVTTVGRSFRKHFGFRAQAIIGGVDRDNQVEGLDKKPHILVATPGRLLDLVDEQLLSLEGVRYVVLDEADKMLSLGLQPQLRRLRKLLIPSKTAAKFAGPLLSVPKRKRPQVLMFSATSTPASEETAKKWLRRAERVHVGTSAANISGTVVQAVQVCAEHKKPQKLLKHLQHIKEKSEGMRNPPRVLIFSNRVKTVRFLQQTVAEAGLRSVMLHGERSQSEREDGMRDFRSGKAQVMVATDVAARGLHIRGLPYVVNYDFPTSLEQYIHRAGRAGRLATNGHCYSFFTRNLAPLAEPLLQLLQEHNQTVDPNLIRLAEAYKTAFQKLLPLPPIREGDGGELDSGADDSAIADADDSAPADAEDDLLADLFGGSMDAGEPMDEARVPPASFQGMNAVVEKKLGVKGGKARKALPGRLRKKLANDKKKAAKS